MPHKRNPVSSEQVCVPQVHEDRDGDADGPVLVEQNGADGVFLQKFLGVTDMVLADKFLLEVAAVHEAVLVAVLVEKLHLFFFEVRFPELLAGTEVPLELGAGEHVPEPALVKRLALAGLDEIELNDDVRITLVFDLEPFSQITAFVHGVRPSLLLIDGIPRRGAPLRRGV